MKLLNKKSVTLLFAGLLVLSGAKVHADEIDKNEEISFKNKSTISLNVSNLNTLDVPLFESAILTTPEFKFNYFFNDQFSAGIGISSSLLVNHLTLSGRYYITSSHDRFINLYTESNLSGSLIAIALSSTSSFTQKVGIEFRTKNNWFINLSLGGGVVLYKSGYESRATYISERFMPAKDISLGFGYAF